VSVTVWTFFTTEFLIGLIALVVIGALTFRALLADPVKNLRTE
jgi:hypothetical protein